MSLPKEPKEIADWAKDHVLDLEDESEIDEVLRELQGDHPDDLVWEHVATEILGFDDRGCSCRNILKHKSSGKYFAVYYQDVPSDYYDEFFQDRCLHPEDDFNAEEVVPVNSVIYVTLKQLEEHDYARPLTNSEIAEYVVRVTRDNC